MLVFYFQILIGKIFSFGLVVVIGCGVVGVIVGIVFIVFVMKRIFVYRVCVVYDFIDDLQFDGL